MKDKERFFILNVDDFGLSKAHNDAVSAGFGAGILTSASLLANGDAFEDAVKIALESPGLGLAVHLNIMEGKALSGCDLLLDDNGFFNKGYGYLIKNQYNKALLEQIEKEFRAQIEKALSVVKIDHLDSHVHTHGIPTVFEIVCRLAVEYNIPAVRTQFETPYFVPGAFLKPINLVKVLLLNYFTLQNRKTLKKYNLKTNDNILGVGYTGMMTPDTIKYGLRAAKSGKVTEALFHPCKYSDDSINDSHINGLRENDSHAKEFQILCDNTLKGEIEALGFKFINYSLI